MPKSKICKRRECGCSFVPTRFAQAYCSPACLYADRQPVVRKRIAPQSDKRIAESKIYASTRKSFLSRPENAICFIEGCTKKATTIEHIKGRTGSLYLDEKFWRPCCLHHNLELERNPELSHEYQLSKIHNGNKGANK